MGSLDEITGEQKNLTLVGIHAGGGAGCIAKCGKSNRDFLPKWWVRVSNIIQ